MKDRREPLLSVVIPTLDESEHLPALLAELARLPVPHEVVVADGGSRDGTVRWARASGARVVGVTPPGRGRQLAAGVAAARAPWLLLLHADVHLHAGAREAVVRWLGSASAEEAAHFRFSLEGRGAFWRFIETGQWLRERLLGLVYGDQGLLVSRTLLDRAGGVPAEPLMEDVELVDRVRAAGRLRRLPATLPTSPRRYRTEGRWRAWLRNTALITLHRLGVPPRRLASLYPPAPGRPTPDDGHDRPGTQGVDTLVVFAKAPRPGAVKTRLAASVGPEAAASIYREMGREVVEAVAGGPWRTVVAFAPDDAGAEVERWLRGTGVELRAQGPGDLGARMDRALRRALEEGGCRACVVGTDTPELDAARVARAFGELRRAEVVVGPAQDGGYYLLGVRRPRPDLFREMPWSTPEVLPRTLERLRREGVSPALLPALRDVDRAEDLRGTAWEAAGW